MYIYIYIYICVCVCVCVCVHTLRSPSACCVSGDARGKQWATAIAAVENDDPSPPLPLECIFGSVPFSKRWDTVRYSGMQLDTARYR